MSHRVSVRYCPVVACHATVLLRLVTSCTGMVSRSFVTLRYSAGLRRFGQVKLRYGTVRPGNALVWRGIVLQSVVTDRFRYVGPCNPR